MNEYSRIFIMLTQERPGAANKSAFGRIVIEIRGEEGKALLNAQNMPPNGSYKLILIIKQSAQNVGVDIGQFWTDARGRAEHKFTFNPQNIINSPMPPNQIEAALIFDSNANITESQPILIGYKASPFSWRVNFVLFDKTQAQSIELEPVEPITEKKIKPEEEIKEEPVPEPPEELDETIEEMPEKIQSNTYNEQDLADNLLQTISRNNIIESILEKEAQVQIFPEISTKWVATTLNEIEQAGAAGQKIANNKETQTLFAKYRHILLGKSGNDYIVAIPDIYKSTTAHSLQEDLGTFKCINANIALDGAHGYWLRVL